jgi:aldose 1-epimerase
VILEYIHQGGTKGYPFKFSMRLTYTLGSRSFSCTTFVRNLDKCAIPMGDGWHPYFTTAGRSNRLLLSLPPHSVVELTGQKVPTGRLVRPNRKMSTIALRRKKLDSVFDLGEKRRRVTTKLINPKSGVELHLWQEAGAGKYRYLVVYRPPSGTSVAIEPWTCAPNAANNKLGLIVLKPGGTFRASYGVRLKSRR